MPVRDVMSVCGVVLTEDGAKALAKVIAPYLKVGGIGKYIICSVAVENGSFIDMTFDPTQTDGSVKDRMVISIPSRFVTFMATGAKTLPIGFVQEA